MFRLSQYIKDRYGSKRGLLNHIKYQLVYKLGYYDKYKNIDFSNVNRLVFVCSGNICRSPLAEVITISSGIPSISFGFHCKGGASADHRAVGYAKKIDLDLFEHQATNIKDYDYQKGDLVFGMEPWHLNLLKNTQIPGCAISVVGLWLNKPQVYIHDPYISSKAYFDLCSSKVVMSVKRLMQSIPH